MEIDAHHHLWTADYAWLAEPGLEPLRRDYTAAELTAHLDANGVRAAVLVEAGRCELAETYEFLALAAAEPRIAGVVGWVSFADSDLPGTLAALRAAPGGDLLVGVRDQVQGRPDPDWLDRPEVRACLAAAGAAGLVVDLVVREDQLPACARAARDLPGTVFVLDHLGKPRITPDGLAAWRAAVTPLAACANVVVKLSGLLTEAGPDWTVERIAPFAATALELFGADRTMLGSDWPVCELVAAYAPTVAALTAALPPLTAPEHAAVSGGTAIRTYRLEVPR
ncbi:amidohydrolase family protein [Catellatospora sp. KI3]|uniref:amidohydrolase family protein n=1 Tax=Catellatospora sp. KI3 TaxID=3041620 RepID=UPI0024832E22|nr:amidohydrolase family protein [Catellatospora sp. KI3]MDI1462120.1 amidohydrolase family protein [Catellatospora sp. KI3]